MNMDGMTPEPNNVFLMLAEEFETLKRRVADLERTVATLTAANGTTPERGYALPLPFEFPVAKPTRSRATVTAVLLAETVEKLRALASAEPVVVGTTPELLKRLCIPNLDAAQLARVLRRLNKDGEKSGLIVKNLGNRVVPEAGTYAQWAVLASAAPEPRKRTRGPKGPSK